MNTQKPFHSPFFKPVIAQTIFGNGLANREGVRGIIEDREIPGNVLALVGTAVLRPQFLF